MWDYAKYVVRLVAVCLTLAAGAALHAGEAMPQAEAFAGAPFGVGTMQVELPPRGKDALPLDSLEFISTLRLQEKNARALYPAFVAHRGAKGGSALVAYFLVRGNGPLALTLVDGRSGRTYSAGVQPVEYATRRAGLLDAWWRAYGAYARKAADADAYPPQVENYVMTMLSRRLKLTLPGIRRPTWGSGETGDFIGLLIGSESVRVAMQRKTLLRGADAKGTADQPLPKPVAPPAVDIPDVPGEVALEPIAMHVPLECFYLRCGSFANFRWLRRFIDRWGTRIRDLASLRGVDYDIRGRIERQLALRETVLAKLLGEHVIADVALIGTDVFLREGAAIGILFQAKNGPVLAAQIGQQRQAARLANRSATEKDVTIGGRTARLLATPDNTVRSFYVIDGDFHLVTTSRALVRRFIEAGTGTECLGKSREFRYARSRMPLSRNDTLFVYLSDPFLRTFVGPQYRVEMTRRMRALAKIELVYLAQMAAKAEGAGAATIRDLVRGGFLPAGFDEEPDGSRIVLAKGRAMDSLRGAVGAFLPVPDVTLTGITASEAEAYTKFSQQYRREWERMDPVTVAVRHVPKTGRGDERVVMDVYITPYARSRYGLLETFLGWPDGIRIAPVPGDLVSLQAVLSGDFPGWDDEPVRKRDRLKRLLKQMLRRQHRIFGSVRDFALPFEIKHGKLEPEEDEMEKLFRGYVGETPRIRVLGWLGGVAPHQPEEDGYVKTGGGYRRAWGSFHLISNRKDTLELVGPKLRFEQMERPAQLRLWVGDLSRRELSALLNAAGYLRTRTVSGANVHFLHALVRGLNAAPRDARRVAERLLNAKLVCPLGGEYVAVGGPAGVWRSTAWKTGTLHEVTAVPKGYRLEALDWFKGLSIEFSIDRRRRSLTTHVELDVKKPGPGAKP